MKLPKIFNFYQKQKRPVKNHFTGRLFEHREKQPVFNKFKL